MSETPFNAGRNFDNAKIMGSVSQDLNNYKCPSCGSSFFFRGCNSGTHYVQCVKSNCHRADIIS